MRYPSLLCWLTFVLVSISAADICGIPKIKPYFRPTLNDTELESILGGDAAVPHSFPWMASIHLNDVFFCAGTIIGKKWILTAAHCLIFSKLNELRITVGFNGIYVPSDTSLTYTILKSYDPGFNFNKYVKDIAVLELTREITFSDHVSPICLPEQDEPTEPDLITIGWGETRGTGDNDVLRQVRLAVTPMEQCNTAHLNDLAVMNHTKICTRGFEPQSGACLVDQGGPLMANDAEFTKKNSDDSKPWVLYGVSTFGLACNDMASRFTRVSHIADWIKTVLED